MVSAALLGQWKYSLPGFLAAASAAVLILFAVVRMQKMNRLDERGTSVLELQKRFYDLQAYRTQMVRWEILLAGILLLAMWPIILWTGFGIDLYANVQLLGITIFLCALLGIVVGIAYERFYRRKMRNTEVLLQEIKELEEE